MRKDDQGAPRDVRPALGRRGLLRSAMAGATLAASGTTLGPAGCAEEGDPSGGVRLDIEDGAVPRIDTHHHVLPPKSKQWMVSEGLLPPTGGPPWATWGLAPTLEMMDAHGIQAGVVSQPAPSDIFVDRARAEVGVRILNEAAAELAAQHPTRFGFFAYLPLAHVDLALQEMAYAAEQLGADGFLLMNHVQNRYLGDPAFDPLFEELDRRGAVVMTHPDSLPAAEGFGLSPQLPDHVADFMLDTTRGALGLMFSGALDRYPNVSIILPHGGGFVPYIGARIAAEYDGDEGPDSGTIRSYLRRFYYDTAAPMSPHSTPTLLATAGAGQLLYGTDWHQVPASVVARNAAALEADPALDRRKRRAIGRENALRLFPRLASRLG